MSLTIDSSSGYRDTLGSRSVHEARGLTKEFSLDGMTLTPETTEEEQQLEESTFTVQRQLSPEEEQRVEYLKSLLVSILAQSEEQPTEDQKARIKDIENEIEDITGVKMHSSLSKATDTMPGRTDKKKKEEEEELRLERQVAGIDPQELAHSGSRLTAETASSTASTGMEMLRRLGTAAYQSRLGSSTGLPLSVPSASGLSMTA
jgi:hypothetical protein